MFWVELGSNGQLDRRSETRGSKRTCPPTIDDALLQSPLCVGLMKPEWPEAYLILLSGPSPLLLLLLPNSLVEVAGGGSRDVSDPVRESAGWNGPGMAVASA